MDPSRVNVPSALLVATVYQGSVPVRQREAEVAAAGAAEAGAVCAGGDEGTAVGLVGGAAVGQAAGARRLVVGAACAGPGVPLVLEVMARSIAMRPMRLKGLSMLRMRESCDGR